MKICYPMCFPGVAGTENYAYYLACEAKKEGIEVVFLLSEDGLLTDKLKKAGIRREIIPMESSFNPIKVMTAVFRLRKFVKAEQIDIVHAMMLREHSLFLGAKLLGSKIKVVRTYHRLNSFNWKTALLNWFYNWQTDIFIAPSNYIKDHMEKNGVHNVRVVYNGVPQTKVKSHRPVVGYLARITEEKGTLPFVEAYAHYYSDREFIIAGQGDQEEELKNVIKEKKLKKLKYLGRITDLPAFFSDIAVMVLPSSHEVMPLAILEAFSAGIPVVAFDIGPLLEVIDDDSGILIPFGDYDKIAQTAFELVENKKLLVEKSKGAEKAYREKYSIELMWSKTKAFYQEALA